MSALEHLAALERAIGRVHGELDRIERWGQHVASVVAGGGRLLAAGNGGSAAQAQHLTAELVGRYLEERPPFSAIALHADTSALTALVNDYGCEAGWADQRQDPLRTEMELFFELQVHDGASFTAGPPVHRGRKRQAEQRDVRDRSLLFPRKSAVSGVIGHAAFADDPPGFRIGEADAQ